MKLLAVLLMAGWLTMLGTTDAQAQAPRNLGSYYPGMNQPKFNIHDHFAKKIRQSQRYQPRLIVGPRGNASVWYPTQTSVPGSSGWTNGSTWIYTRPIGGNPYSRVFIR